MADFTEDDLSKALNDLVETEGDLVKDLKEEEKVEEPKTEEVADPKPEEPTETAGDDKKTDEPAEQEPEQTPTEPEEKADEPQEPEMILGKFKTQDDLIKAYQNLEKRFSEKSQEVKQVEKVTSNDFDDAVQRKIAEENWKLVDRAFATIADPEHAKEAQFLLLQFKRTGDPEFLEKARGYLDARVDRRLEVDTMNTAARITQVANEHRQEILLKPLADELDQMAEEDPEFMGDKQNQELMAMAIKLNPTTIDVRAVKKAIQDYSKAQYQRGYDAAKKEVAKQAETKAVSVKSVAKAETPVHKKPVEEMSIKEQLEEEYKDIPSIL